MPVQATADDWELVSLSLRARLTNDTTLGDPQPEEFEEYDLAAHYRIMPWRKPFDSGWIIEPRLMASAGLLRAAGENGVVVSLIPQLAFQWKGFVTDLGIGFALLTPHKYGTQDYGGPFQFALTAGLKFPLYRHVGFGYRFMHYSDAGVNGEGTIGADFHMLELYYSY